MTAQDRWLRLTRLKAESGELLHLDLLRFVAAVGIVLCHSIEFLSLPAERAWSHARTAGLPLFVDVFFVISGYVISHVYAGRIASARDYGRFMQRRFGRLLPLHLATLCAAYVVAIAMVRADVPMAHPPDLSTRCVATAALLLHAWYDCGGLVLNGVSWSISAEMAMYAAFPLFIWLIGGRAWRAGALAAAAFALLLWHRDGVAVQEGFDVLRALPAFLWGMFLFRAAPMLSRVHGGDKLMAAGAVLLCIGSAALWPNLAMVAIAYVIPAFAVAADRRGKVALGVTMLAPLGQLTYSIYMLHGLMIMLVLNGLGDKLLGLSPWPMLGLLLATLASIGVAGWISLQLFETPLRIAIDRWPIFAPRSRPGTDPRTMPHV